MLLVKKFNFSLYLFSVKIILQIMFNNVLDRNIFPKGLTDAFGQKCIYFSLFVFGQNKTRNNV